MTARRSLQRERQHLKAEIQALEAEIRILELQLKRTEHHMEQRRLCNPRIALSRESMQDCPT